MKRTVCARGSAETELRLKTAPEDWIVEKPGYGLQTTTVQQMAEAEICRALLCGVDTDACVLGVAFSLFDGGVDCEIDPELCWGSAGLHDAALNIIRGQFGTA